MAAISQRWLGGASMARQQASAIGEKWRWRNEMAK